MIALPVTELPDGVRFGVRVQPRASRNAIAGLHGGALKIQLTALPADGRANEALVAFLAERLHVTRAAVSIVAGGSTRSKVIAVTGITAADVGRLIEIAER